MTDIQITSFAKARICVERRPSLEFKSKGELIRTVIAREAASHGHFLCLEALVPRGARADYGLLGIEYEPEPQQSNQLTVIVRASDMEGRRWPHSLAATFDDVRVGLPSVYSEAVIAGLVDDQHESCAGSLVVTEAAHGMVGSSPNFFRRLARAASAMLFAEHDMQTDFAADHLRRLLL